MITSSAFPQRVWGKPYLKDAYTKMDVFQRQKGSHSIVSVYSVISNNKDPFCKWEVEWTWPAFPLGHFLSLQVLTSMQTALNTSIMGVESIPALCHFKIVTNFCPLHSPVQLGRASVVQGNDEDVSTRCCASHSGRFLRRLGKVGQRSWRVQRPNQRRGKLFGHLVAQLVRRFTVDF